MDEHTKSIHYLLIAESDKGYRAHHGTAQGAGLSEGS